MELDLKRIVVRILKGLKFIFIFALAGAIILGGSAVAATFFLIDDAKSLYSDLDYNKNIEETYDEMERKIAEEDWLKLDPNTINSAALIFGVKGKDSTNLDNESYYSICNSYVYYIRSIELLEKLNKELDLHLGEDSYAKLVGVEYKDSSIFITVIYDDAVIAEKIRDFIFNNAVQKTNQLVMQHDIYIISREARNKSQFSDWLLEEQHQYMQKADLLKREAASISSDSDIVLTKDVVRRGMKYALIGMVLFGCLALIALFLLDLIDQKVSNGWKLAERTRLTWIGSLHAPRKKITILNRTIDYLSGESSTVPYEEQLRIVKATVAAYIKESRGKVVITGTAPFESIERICKDLNGVEVEHNTSIAFVPCKDIFSSSRLISEISNATAVILLEIVDKSVMTNVSLEVERLNKIHAPLFGFVLYRGK